MRYFINECHDGKDGGLISTAISPSSGSPGVTSCVFFRLPDYDMPGAASKDAVLVALTIYRVVDLGQFPLRSK